MIELHPAIVHFPVALLSIAALFGVVSLFVKRELFQEIAFWNLLLGVIGAIAAVLTGLIEEQSLAHNEEIHKLLTKHEFTGFGILILSFSLLTWGWVRKNKFGRKEYILWVLSLMLGAGIIFYQGWLGGRMVFEQGAGVKPMESRMDQHSDSLKTHTHSKQGHADSSDQESSPSKGHSHSNAQERSPSKGVLPEKGQHTHSGSGQDDKSRLDTSKKQDNKQATEKKKELKDMKY